MNDLDISDTIKPKTDQLNADDLITGSLTITITNVKKTGAPEQPFSASFEGDNGKPFKPSLGMRRVMVKVWGANAANYVGKSLTLYNDPEVTFGKDKVGGIRISHMSHIDRQVSMALTVAKARRKQFTVQPLKAEERREQNQRTESAAGIDAQALIALAYSTAEGGSDIYRDWYVGVGGPSQAILNKTEEPDKGDFDAVRSVHEICKRISGAV